MEVYFGYFDTKLPSHSLRSFLVLLRQHPETLIKREREKKKNQEKYYLLKFICVLPFLSLCLWVHRHWVVIVNIRKPVRYKRNRGYGGGIGGSKGNSIYIKVSIY